MNEEQLFNKYRPLKFESVKGNDSAVRVLRALVNNKRVGGTNYIFSGSPGTGKTTTARIFARAINCLKPIGGEPCNICYHCESHLRNTYSDYIEIDGASYNKVDDAERLVELANQHPIKGSFYRVILIDEAHRLSNQAFDKFLMLLESAVTRTVFMFATTDLQLLRPAIVSRCFNFAIKPMSYSEVESELEAICKGEGVSYRKSSLLRLSRSFPDRPRDAVKTLDLLLRTQGNLEEYLEETPESVLLTCFKLAYHSKVSEYMRLLESLVIPDLCSVISRMFNEVYMYPALTPVFLSPKDIDSFKALIDKEHLQEIIKNVVLYKPDTIYTVCLILTQVSDLGGRIKYEVKKANKFKGRRFVGDSDIIDEEPPVEIGVTTSQLEEFGFEKL